MAEGVKLNAKAKGEYHFLANRYPDFMLRALKEGEQKGRAEGSYKTKIGIAKKCLKLKMPLDTISSITSLTMEEIAKL